MTKLIALLLTTLCLLGGYRHVAADSADPDPRAIAWPTLQANLSEATAREIVAGMMHKKSYLTNKVPNWCSYIRVIPGMMPDEESKLGSWVQSVNPDDLEPIDRALHDEWHQRVEEIGPAIRECRDLVAAIAPLGYVEMSKCW